MQWFFDFDDEIDNGLYESKIEKIDDLLFMRETIEELHSTYS